jgi:hypothetical protein
MLSVSLYRIVLYVWTKISLPVGPVWDYLLTLNLTLRFKHIPPSYPCSSTGRALPSATSSSQSLAAPAYPYPQ